MSGRFADGTPLCAASHTVLAGGRVHRHFCRYETDHDGAHECEYESCRRRWREVRSA